MKYIGLAHVSGLVCKIYLDEQADALLAECPGLGNNWLGERGGMGRKFKDVTGQLEQICDDIKNARFSRPSNEPKFRGELWKTVI